MSYNIFLNLGDIAVTDKERTLKTILGSCISVCLCDRKNLVAGMCHFVEAERPKNKKPDNYYGEDALPNMLEQMLEKGAQKHHIEAKVFGGAKMLQNINPELEVGKTNSKFAIKFLNRQSIKILEEDTGGHESRELNFQVKDFQTECIKTESSAFNHFQDVFSLIKKETGNDPKDKAFFFYSKIKKRMQENSIDSFEDYTKFLKTHEDEKKLLISIVTNHSTQWDRHKDDYDFLIKNINYNVFNESRPLKILSAASSTGEEAYSYALYLENAKRKNPGFSYKIQANDIDQVSIDTAIAGRYDLKDLKSIPEIFHHQFYVREDHILIGPHIKNRCDFSKRDLRAFHQGERNYDQIFCKNVLIYFSDKDTQVIIDDLCDRLNVGGYIIFNRQERIKKTFLKQVSPGIYQKV